MSLRNDMSKHRLSVQRLVGTEQKNIKLFLDKLEKRAISVLETGSPRAVKAALRKTMSDLHKVALDNMTDIAAYEAKFAAKTFSKYFVGELSVPDADKLKKVLKSENLSINNVKFKNGVAIANDEYATRKSLITAYKQYGQRKADDIAQVIADARIKGLTALETRAVISERINGLHTAQSRVLADTAINYSTNIAKSQVIAENRDIIAQEVWICDIELNSCDECLSYQSEGVQPVGSFPSPAIHWGCQCEVIHMLNNWLNQQDKDFKAHVGDPVKYMRTSISLKELEELDNRFISNPEGNNERSNTGTDSRGINTGSKL